MYIEKGDDGAIIEVKAVGDLLKEINKEIEEE